jgi:hypothetical protein
MLSILTVLVKETDKLVRLRVWVCGGVGTIPGEKSHLNNDT